MWGISRLDENLLASQDGLFYGVSCQLQRLYFLNLVLLRKAEFTYCVLTKYTSEILLI
jgi:hypothetical protein